MCWWRHSIAKGKYCVLTPNRGEYSVVKVRTYEGGGGRGGIESVQVRTGGRGGRNSEFLLRTFFMEDP